MALGNYNSLTYNERGEPNDGTFISPMGVKVQVYKNWLYVHDEHSWQNDPKDMGFSSPTVMQVHFGHIAYKDVEMLVTFHDHYDTCCFVVWCPGYHYDDQVTRGMLGMAAYAYDEDMVHAFDGEQVEYLREVYADSKKAREFTWNVQVDDGENQGIRYIVEHMVDGGEA